MRRNWHHLPFLRKALIIAIELLLLPAQIILTLPLLVLGIAVGLILYPARAAWGERAMRTPITINHAVSRFRRRIAGDPRAKRYTSL
jgi:hypothetical protein